MCACPAATLTPAGQAPDASIWLILPPKGAKTVELVKIIRIMVNPYQCRHALNPFFCNPKIIHRELFIYTYNPTPRYVC
jgi:histone acetyltransferase (RNA polymerase elongator complex component)